MNRNSLTNLKKDIILTMNKGSEKKTSNEIINKYKNNMDNLVKMFYIITYFDDFVFINSKITETCNDIINKISENYTDNNYLPLISSALNSNKKDQSDIMYIDNAINSYLYDLDMYVNYNNKISHEEYNEILASLKVIEKIKNDNSKRKESTIFKYIHNIGFNHKSNRIIKKTKELKQL